MLFLENVFNQKLYFRFTALFYLQVLVTVTSVNVLNQTDVIIVLCVESEYI